MKEFGGPSSLRETIIDLMKKYEIAKTHEEPITLSSGKESNFYVDLRRAAGIPSLFDYITTLAAKKLTNGETEQLVGIELFGAIYAHAIAMKAGINCCTLRKEPKKHGMKNALEGYMSNNIKGFQTIIVDDVLTTGSSIIKGLEQLKEYALVKKAFVIVDRQEGGKEILESKGISLESLFTREDLI